MLNNSFLLIREPRLNYDRFLHKIICDPTQQKIRNMAMSLLLNPRSLALFLTLALPHVCLKLCEHLVLSPEFPLNLRYQLRLINL